MKTSRFVLSFVAGLVAAASLHAQTITIDKPQLSFNALVGSATPQTQTITASSSPSGAFFIAQVNTPSAPTSWLKITTAGLSGYQTALTGTTGQSSGTIQVQADPTNLPAGNYTGTILFNNVALVTVSFSVGSIGVLPQTLSFAYQSGGSLPPASTITLSGSGAFTASASTTSGGAWLTVTPSSGTVGTVNTLTVALDPNISPTLAAGTYTGQIAVNPIGVANPTSAIVAVTLTVTAAPTATLSTSAINLVYQIGGANNNPSQTLNIATNSQQPLVFSVNPFSNTNPSGRNWIVANPSNGQICQSAGAGCTAPANGTASVSISYDTTANLPAGTTWTGIATVLTLNATPAQQTVPVNLLVSTLPLLSVPTSSLSFAYQLNGALPATQTVTASSTNVATTATTGQMPISVAVTQGANWLSVTPPTGVSLASLTTGMPLTVSTNPAGLATGKYTGTIVITGIGAGNPPQAITVILNVANDPLIVTNAPGNGLNFVSQVGQNPVIASQISQAITVNSSSSTALNYSVTANYVSCGTGWLALTGATSGPTSNSFTVSAVTTGISKAVCSGSVTISATNPATGNPAVNSPVTIPVILYVDPNPMLVPLLPGNPPAPPAFTTSVNGAAPAAQSITLYSTNPSAPITYSTTFSTNTGANWLFVSPSGGTTATGQNTITVVVTPGLLSAGTYTGNIIVTATGTVANSPITIPVTFTVTGGVFALSPSSLAFNQAAGGVAPAAQTVQVTSSGVPLSYTAAASINSGSGNWLSVSAATAAGTTPGSISVSVDGSKLPQGTYSGMITVSAPNATPATLPVTLTVSPGTISAPTTTLTFTQAAGGPAPPTQAIQVTGTPGSLNFSVGTSVVTGAGWLSAVVGTGTSTTGTTPATVTVSANGGPTGAVGTYTGNVTITSAGATGSPITIPVVLNLVPPQSLAFTSNTPLSFNYNIGVTPTPLTQTVGLTSSGSAQFTTTATAANNGTWLSVTPATGTATTTATNLTVSVNPTGLAAGTYSGMISVNSPSSLTPLTLPVNLTVAAVVPPSVVAIKNSASYSAGAVAPGELVLIGGTNVGPATLTFGAVANNQLSTLVGGTQVFFDNVAAPIYYASATQTAVFVPYEVNGRPTTSVTVVSQGATSPAVTYNVISAQPGIFTQNSQGTGPGSILNPDNSINGPNNGVAGGSYIQVFMTGEGQTSPPGVTGSIIPSNGSGLKTPVGTVTASIGGVPLPASAILYAGSAPGDVSGVFQVDLVIPTGLTPGPQPLIIAVGGISSQTGVTVQLK